MSVFSGIDCVIVDADDTLWHDGRYYARVDRCFIEMCGDAAIEAIARIDANAAPGERSYASAILAAATALGVDDRLLRETCDAFLDHDVELLTHVEETLAALSPIPIVVVTKGPIAEQQTKLLRSGLRFADAIFVPRKNADTWREVFIRLSVDPSRAITIGNNLDEDIRPPDALGGRTIWLNHPENPYRTDETPPHETWIVDGWMDILKEVVKR